MRGGDLQETPPGCDNEASKESERPDGHIVQDVHPTLSTVRQAVPRDDLVPGGFLPCTLSRSIPASGSVSGTVACGAASALAHHRDAPA